MPNHFEKAGFELLARRQIAKLKGRRPETHGTHSIRQRPLPGRGAGNGLLEGVSDIALGQVMPEIGVVR
jgi:hypothetical protein